MTTDHEEPETRGRFRATANTLDTPSTSWLGGSSLLGTCRVDEYTLTAASKQTELVVMCEP